MSDDKKPDDAKEAVPDQRPPLAGKLPSKQTSWSQQVFIWTMVILVGVIFGVGPSVGLAFHRAEPISSYKVDQAQLELRLRIASTVDQVTGMDFHGRRSRQVAQDTPWGRRGWAPSIYDVYARDYRRAQYAADRGLMPTGAALDRMVHDFLAREAPAGRTVAQLMRDDRRASDLTERDLRLLIAEEAAVEALLAQAAAAPPVPRAAAADVTAASGDRVSVDVVELSAKPLLPEVKPDDPEFDAGYATLKEQGRFRIAPQLKLQVASADLDALAKAHEPDEAAVKAYYDANPKEFEVAAPAPAEGQTPPAPTIKPLAEVADQIKATLRRKAALADAAKRIEALQAAVDEQGLEDKDAAAFAAAVQAAGLTVKEVAVEDDADAELAIPGFGTLKQKAKLIGLHIAKAGFISEPQTGSRGEPLVLRLVDRVRESIRAKVDEKGNPDPIVVEAVVKHLAGKRAYAQLLTEAERIRAAAEAAGVGGLRSVLAAEAEKKWEAKVNTREVDPTTPITPPAPPAGSSAVRGEPRPVVSLAVKGNPVAVSEMKQSADVPSVLLVQVVGYKAAEAPTGDAVGQAAERLHQQVGALLRQQADQAVERDIRSGG